MSKTTLKVVRQQPRRPGLLVSPLQHLVPLNRRTLVFLEPNLLSKPLLLYLGVRAPQILPTPVQLLVHLVNPSTSHRPRILVTYLGVVPLVNHSSSSSSLNNNKMRLEAETGSGSPSNSRPMLLAAEHQLLVIMHPNPLSPLSVEVRIYSLR